jgi:SAM-dependent methyltransferase
MSEHEPSPAPSGGDESSAPLIPPVSGASQPRFRSRDRREELARAFEGEGLDYDRLRPGYPAEAIARLLAAAPGARDAVDLGTGTGKLALALAAEGLEVIGVDPSASMLEVLDCSCADRSCDDGSPDDAPRPATGRLRTHLATAEATGLPDASADLVTVAQAWHWFDTAAAGAEVLRILRPGGVLALLWNTLDVAIPWVHRYSRIMHAGDVQRDGFSPPLTPGLELQERAVLRWEEPMTTPDMIDLARTRSYVITANEPTRATVLANLDWYLHDHLGHARGSTIGLPYRTDLFLIRPADTP